MYYCGRLLTAYLIMIFCCSFMEINISMEYFQLSQISRDYNKGWVQKAYISILLNTFLLHLGIIHLFSAYIKFKSTKNLHPIRHLLLKLNKNFSNEKCERNQINNLMPWCLIAIMLCFVLQNIIKLYRLLCVYGILFCRS